MLIKLAPEVACEMGGDVGGGKGGSGWSTGVAASGMGGVLKIAWCQGMGRKSTAPGWVSSWAFPPRGCAGNCTKVPFTSFT